MILCSRQQLYDELDKVVNFMCDGNNLRCYECEFNCLCSRLLTIRHIAYKLVNDS